MFRCQKCKKQSYPGNKPEKIQIFRSKTYKYKKKVDRKKYVDMISHGVEIDKEFIVCGKCKKENNNDQK